MRDGILESLPETLPLDKLVVIIGSDSSPGMNGVKRLVHDLCRDGEWIRMEHGDVAADRLPERAGVILTMSAIKGPTLVKVRDIAKDRGIPGPFHALTVGEVKETLWHLDALRRSPQEGASNEGTSPEPKLDPEPDPAPPTEEVADTTSAPEPTELTEPLVATATEPTPTQTTAHDHFREQKEFADLVFGEAAETLGEALRKLEGLRQEFVSLEPPVDQTAPLQAEIQRLQAELGESHNRFAELSAQLAAKEEWLTKSRAAADASAEQAATKIATLEAQNTKLTERNGALEGALDVFNAALARVKK